MRCKTHNREIWKNTLPLSQTAPTCVMMSVLLSMSSTSGFVSRSCWIWGLDRMSCLVIWGLEVERVLCTRGLRRTLRIISGSDNSCFSICHWSVGMKPGLSFVRPRLSRPSTVGTGSGQEVQKKDTKNKFQCGAVLTQPEGRGGRWCEHIVVRVQNICELRLDCV